MAGVTELTGSITSGPQSVVDTTFPSMQDTVQLRLTPSPKQWQCCTGAMSRNVASPSSYVTLDGIGSAATVTHADFLYLRCNATLRLKMTQVDGITTLVSEQDVSGLIVVEKPSGGCITLLEVKGTATLEYLAAGQS